MKKSVLFGLLLVGALFSANAMAQVPLAVHYQGYLTDKDGVPISQDMEMTFELFSEQIDGQPFFSETQSVSVADGYFFVIIGAKPGNGISPDSLSSGAAWLSITMTGVGAPVTLNPRQRLVSSPFSMYSALAFKAKTADDAKTVGGVSPTKFLQADTIGDVCVLQTGLDAALKKLGYTAAPPYTDQDVQNYLDSLGIEAGTYGDDDVTYYLKTHGFVAGAAKWNQIEGKPEGLLTLTNIGASGLVLMANGSVPATGALDMSGNQIRNLVIHSSETAAPPLNPKVGQLWYDSNEDNLKIYSKTGWAGLSKASSVDCPGCVDPSDVSFNYSASAEKGGAALNAKNLECEGCVSATEAAFNWAGSTAPGGPATGLDCTGCLSAAHLSVAAKAAKEYSYDPTASKIEANTVQAAIDFLAAKDPGAISEGNGTVVPITANFTFPASGSAVFKYVHLMNPATPRIYLYLYSEYPTGGNGSRPTGVKIFIDGVDVTGKIGDQNSKGSPNWNSSTLSWGKDASLNWSTGLLNITNAVPWFLGAHKIELRQTMNSGGPIDMYFYAVYPFTKALPPENDLCAKAMLIDVMGSPLAISGTTEDTMGRTLATDDYSQTGCGGVGGPDVVYKFTLTNWRQLAIAAGAGFDTRLYLRKGDCLTGLASGCGLKTLTTDSLRTGTYYLFVDSDSAAARGDFGLSITGTPPGPPPNDSCTAPAQLVFDAEKKVTVYGHNLFSTNDYNGPCGGWKAGDNVYYFDIPAGYTKLTYTVEGDFTPAVYISNVSCVGAYSFCAPLKTMTWTNLSSGRWWMVVDGYAETDKGEYVLSITLQP